REAIAARVGECVVDLARPLLESATIVAVLPESREGTEVLRHSTAHLLAHAVKRLFPETQVTIGPVIENGFYYDFKRERPFTPEDLARIEKTMRDLASENIPVVRRDVTKRDAVALFREMGEAYKVEIIEGIPE